MAIDVVVIKRALSAVEAAEAASTRGVATSSGPETTWRSEYDFTLPRGFRDRDGRVHRDGTMRLATARDELLPLLDPRVRDHSAFLSIVLLGRVITQLGDLPAVNDSVVENMYATDVAFLQDLYRRINTEGHTRAAVACPACTHEFAVDMAGGRLGES